MMWLARRRKRRRAKRSDEHAKKSDEHANRRLDFLLAI
jgi:hypothetical protein